MDKIFRMAGLVAFLVAATHAASWAADDVERRSGRARTYLVLRIAETLELNDEKALQVSKILQAADERREALRGERQVLAPELERAIAAGDESAIEELVAKARDLDRKMQTVAADSFQEIEGLLTVIERGKLALLIPELQNQMRRGARRGPGGPMRGGPGAPMRGGPDRPMREQPSEN